MSTHTPGPWNCASTGTQMRDGYTQPFGIAHFGEGSQVTLIAGCFGDLRGGDKVASANARLIASAPELLDELRNARQVIADALSVGAPDFFRTEEEIATHHAIARIDRVIAKATGAS